ncbi:DUF1836 domain-containing protein [Neobacillus sp. SM06]|uniref:DUF1836 domain-containing protein n=1 Tax=Neobacillus sp. SM06 TaxID=3422492 RepID=UPI003D29D1E4
MDKLQEIFEKLDLEGQLPLDEIPSIDLYMDQVIQLFEKKFAESKRTPDEKILTKTMINNYAKGKLLFPIKNKKYSKEHLILISLIYQLKGALSINDIKGALSGINEKAEKGSFKLDDFYSSYLQLISKNTADFKEALTQQEKDLSAAAKEFENESEKATFEPVLTIASLVHMSNLYRRAAEKLVDHLQDKHESNGH